MRRNLDDAVDTRHAAAAQPRGRSAGRPARGSLLAAMRQGGRPVWDPDHGDYA